MEKIKSRILKNNFVYESYQFLKVYRQVGFKSRLSSMGLLNDDNSKRWKRLKGQYAGKRCFIIGNGPSLKISDLERLKGEYTFGSNRIYLAFKDTEWRPTFYCVQDVNVIREHFNEINSYNFNTIFSTLNIKQEGYIFKNGLYYYLQMLPNFAKGKPGFSKNIAYKVNDGATITFSAIQIAMYMGFSQIYLLGVDNNYNPSTDSNLIGQNSYFIRSYLGNKKMLYPNTNEMERSYILAKQISNEMDVKIYNATRGGNLEVFERKDFDQLFTRNGKVDYEPK